MFQRYASGAGLDMSQRDVVWSLTHADSALFFGLVWFDLLCDNTDFILREGSPFEAMTGHTVFIDRLLAEGFRFFSAVR